MENKFLSAECGGLSIIIASADDAMREFRERNVAMHAHMNFEIHVLYEGSARIETESGFYTLLAGDAAVISPNVYHSSVNTTRAFRLVTMNFSLYQQARAKRFSEFSECLRYLYSSDVVVLHDSKNIFRLFDLLRKELKSGSFGTEELQRVLLEEFIVFLFRAVSASAKNDSLHNMWEIGLSSEQAELTKAERMMIIESYMKHSFQDATIEELSRRLGVSPQHTRRILHNEYKMSFSDMLNRHRINESKKLLESTEQTITKIGISVGFSNPQSFSGVFKKETGCTPSEYRYAKRHESA